MNSVFQSKERSLSDAQRNLFWNRFSLGETLSLASYFVHTTSKINLQSKEELSVCIAALCLAVIVLDYRLFDWANGDDVESQRILIQMFNSSVFLYHPNFFNHHVFYVSLEACDCVYGIDPSKEMNEGMAKKGYDQDAYSAYKANRAFISQGMVCAGLMLILYYKASALIEKALETNMMVSNVKDSILYIDRFQIIPSSYIAMQDGKCATFAGIRDVFLGSKSVDQVVNRLELIQNSVLNHVQEANP